MEGRILTVNTGSTSTKIGFFDAGELVFEQKVFLSAETLAKYGSVMDLETEMKDAITEFLLSRGVELETIDVVMARGGLITPVVTGVYRVNKAMRDALYEGKEGVHACNLSAIIADDIAVHIDALRKARGPVGVRSLRTLPWRMRCYLNSSLEAGRSFRAEPSSMP